MAARALAALTALVLVAAVAGARQKVDVWGPEDSIKALDAAAHAIGVIAKLPGLSQVQKERALQASADVKTVIEVAEGGGNLTKAQAREKIHTAMQELSGLSGSLKAFMANATALQGERAKLEHELALKKDALNSKMAELAKDEKMLKLVKMQKELMEKKELLQALMNQKAAAQSGRDAAQEQAQQAAMVKSLLKTVQGLKGTKAHDNAQDVSAGLPAPFARILTDLQTRERNVSAALTRMEAQERESEASLEATLRKQVPVRGKDDAVTKGRSVLKMLKAQERRKYHKARAMKLATLKELKDAEQSIRQHDVAGLQRVLARMESEGKALEAKTGAFLH